MLTIIMHRPIPAVGSRIEGLVAAVTSIVLTVAAIVGTVLRVHADQTEWAAVTDEPTADAADEPVDGNGGASAWV